MEQTNIKVIIKPRPRIQREKEANENEQWSITGNTIECKNPFSQHRYTFGKQQSHLSFHFFCSCVVHSIRYGVLFVLIRAFEFFRYFLWSIF